MAKQMLIDATRGRRTEKAPWVPYAGVNCAYLIKEKRQTAISRIPNLIAKGIVAAAKTYRCRWYPVVVRPVGGGRSRLGANWNTGRTTYLRCGSHPV
jgi:hypothetical protein